MSSSSNARSIRTLVQCNYCKEQGHRIPECPKLLCARCRIRGHTTSSCSKKRPEATRPSPQRAEPQPTKAVVKKSEVVKKPTNVFGILSADSESSDSENEEVVAYTRNFPSLPCAKPQPAKVVELASALDWAATKSDSDSD